MKYDKAYFIAKFAAIPDDRWRAGKLADSAGRCCALGHCGKQGANSDEGRALIHLFPTEDAGLLTIAKINDGSDPRYQQITPKLRVLAALRDLA